MIDLLLKYFTISLNCYYIFAKLLNLEVTAKRIVIDTAFALMCALIVLFLKLYLPPLIIPVMVAVSIAFLTLANGIKLELSITTTILSFGISYTTFGILLLFSSIIFKLFNISYSTYNVGVLTVIVSIVQLLIARMPFKFRRLKSGMPFLKTKGASNTGVFISVILLCLIFFINSKEADLIYILPVILIFLCGVTILFWWRGKLTKTYIARLREDELNDLNETIQNKEIQIQNLTKQNDALAKIIHKDNKLIPAMELAVIDYLESYDGSSEKAGEIGRDLLTQLKKMFDERLGVIKDYQFDNVNLPLTKVISIDSLMKYMFNKAKENGVILDLTLNGSTAYMVENIISDSELRTLLADLIENAIIATKRVVNKKILVSIGISEGHYFISVLDSGIPFELKTIADLGIKKATTHAEEGGSGIGLLTIFQIAKRHSASFILEEFSNNNIYTKRISIKFDGQNQYIVKSARYNTINSLSQREELVVLQV